MNLHLWFEDRVGLHGFTVSYGTAHQLKQYACQQRRVPNGNVKNLQSRLLFSGYANFSYFTLLFGRVRLRKVQNALAKLLFCSLNLLSSQTQNCNSFVQIQGTCVTHNLFRRLNVVEKTTKKRTSYLKKYNLNDTQRIQVNANYSYTESSIYILLTAMIS